MIDLNVIGRNCKSFRISKGYRQLDIANDTGYSIENVSSFECGRNDNCRFLLWYIQNGISKEELMKGANV